MFRCKHKWKIIKEIQVYSRSDRTIPHQIIYLLGCDECGKLKKVKVG